MNGDRAEDRTSNKRAARNRAAGDHAPGDRIVVPLRQPVNAWVRWTAALRQDFLDRLAATCNVTASAAATGITPDAAARLRRRDPAFAAAWEEALEAGYLLLEIRLVGHVLAGATRQERIEAAGTLTETIDVDTALRLLKERELRRGGVRSRRDPSRLKCATEAETDAAILRLLRPAAARSADPA